MCVERMKQCDDIVALAAELDIHRRLLYRWRDQRQSLLLKGRAKNSPHATRGA